GEIKESRIDESVRRILAAKSRLGLDKNRFVDIGKLDRALGTNENQRTAQQIIDGAITLVRNKGNVLPLKLAREKRVLFISMVDNSEGWRDGVPGRAFFGGLLKRYPNSLTVYVTDKTSPVEFDLIKKLVAFSDAVVVNGFIRVSSF